MILFRKKIYKDGDTRVISKFLFFPFKLRKGNCLELRWMERIGIFQVLRSSKWRNDHYFKPLSGDNSINRLNQMLSFEENERLAMQIIRNNLL